MYYFRDAQDRVYPFEELPGDDVIERFGLRRTTKKKGTELMAAESERVRKELESKEATI